MHLQLGLRTDSLRTYKITQTRASIVMLHVIRCADCCTGIQYWQYRTTYFRITFQFRLDIRSTSLPIIIVIIIGIRRIIILHLYVKFLKQIKHRCLIGDTTATNIYKILPQRKFETNQNVVNSYEKIRLRDLC